MKDKLLLKYVWNVILMITFVITAATAILYFFNLSGVSALIINIHVQMGLAAVWVGLYHAAKRLTFYVKCVPWGRKSC